MEVERLVEAVLANGSPYEEGLHRDLLWAADTLAEDVTRSARLLDTVRERLVGLVASRVPSLRHRALAGMAGLLNLGHEPIARTFLAWLREGATLRLEALRALVERHLEQVPETLRGGLLELFDALHRHDLERDQRDLLVEVLGRVASRDEPVRQFLLQRVDDEGWQARKDAIKALGRWALQDEPVRQALLGHLEDKSPSVRKAVHDALHPAAGREDPVPSQDGPSQARDFTHALAAGPEEPVRLSAVLDRDERVREALLARLESESWETKCLLVSALAQKPCDDVVDGGWFLPWLGITEERRLTEDRDDGAEARLREQVAQAVARRAGQDGRLRERVVDLLRHPDWNMRLGAALALSLIPGEPPASVLLILSSLLRGSRQEGDWLLHLLISERLLDVPDREARERALACALRALEYGPHPWVQESVAAEVRGNAVRMLGRLRSLPHREPVVRRVLELVREDPDETVRENAYQTALRLLAAPVEATTSQP